MLVRTEEKRAVFAELLRSGDAAGARALALEMREGSAGDESLRWSNNVAAAEFGLGDFGAALAALGPAAALADTTSDHALAGNYYNNSAAAHMALWQTSEDEAQLDAALVEFEGAAYHYGLSGDRGLVASATNNAAALLVALGRFAEAYPKLEEARSTYLKLGEVCRAAVVDETEARARLKAGERRRALTLAARAVAVLSEYEDGALAEAEATLRAVLDAG